MGIKILGIANIESLGLSSGGIKFELVYKFLTMKKWVNMIYYKEKNIIAFIDDGVQRTELENQKNRRKLLLEVVGKLENTPTQTKLLKDWKEQDEKNEKEKRAEERQRQLEDIEQQILQLEHKKRSL